MPPRNRKKVVFKKIPVDVIDRLLGLTEAQLKVWLYHYRREGGGDDRKSYSSRDTAERALAMKPNTISKARTWLVRHGWLKVVGVHVNGHGGQPVREYVCLFGNSDFSTTKVDSDHHSAKARVTDITVERGSQSPFNGDSNPPKVDTVEVTPSAALPAIPREVFRPTNSGGSEQVSEQAEEGASAVAFEKQNSSGVPRTVDEFWSMSGDNNYLRAQELLYTFKPVLTDAVVEKHMPAAIAVVNLMPDDIEPRDLVKWNQVHRSHKYATKQDKAMYLRSPEQMLKAMLSENGALLNDYETHDFENCALCKEFCLVHTRTLRAEIAAKREAERCAENERKARLAEAERRSEEDRRKQERWSRYDFTPPDGGIRKLFKFNMQFSMDDVRNHYCKVNPDGRQEWWPYNKAAFDATINWLARDGAPFDKEDFLRVLDDARECWLAQHQEYKRPQEECYGQP